MKAKPFFVMITFCTVIGACRKGATTAFTPPISVDFELIDQSGNSLVKNLKDSIKVSYMQDGVLKYHNLNVEKLQVVYNDTTTVKHYNGLVIDDERFITDLSDYNVNPVRNFTMYLNGAAMGNLYFEYRNFLDVPYPSKYATFNNVPCTLDVSFKYFSPGIGIVVLQTQ